MMLLYIFEVDDIPLSMC